MTRLLIAVATLALGCESPLPDVPDSGPAPLACYVPLDGGVFTSGLSKPVPGCTASGQPTGVLDLADAGWLIHGGVLVVPDSPPGTPLPVVIAFHPAGTAGEVVRAQLALEPLADGGAIFAYPNAASPTSRTWDIGPTSGDGLWIDILLRKLSESYCIDPDRIYIAGFSAGAVFTLYLGCNVPGTFRAMAVVAGTEDRFDTRCCKEPLSALFIHGLADETISAGEGHNAADEVLRRDHCPLSPAGIDAQQCELYACPAPLAVEFCPWEGGHFVPDFAPERIWRFFSTGS